MEDLDFFKKIGKGAGILLFGIFLSKFLTYVFRAIVAKYFGASVYGLLALSIAVVSSIATFAILGLQEGLLRYVAFYSGKDKKFIAPLIGAVFKVVFPVSLLLGVVVFLFSNEISVIFFHKPELTLFLRISAFLIPILILYNISDKVLQAFQDAGALVAAKNLIDPLSKILLLVLFIAVGIGELGVIVAYILGMAFTLLVFGAFLRTKILNFRDIFLRPGSLSREFIYYSLPLLFASFIITLLSWIDTIILGMFVSSASVGIYDAASATSRLVTIVPLAFSTMFMPAITVMFAEGKSNISGLYKRISKWIILMLFPMLAFLAIFSRPILSSFFGAEFVAGAGSLVVLVLSQVFWGMNLLSSNILEMLKHSKLIFLNCVLSAVMSIILNFILIPKYGIIGAAIGTAIVALFVNLLYILEASYLIKTNPFDFYMFKLLLSIAVPVIVLFLIFGRGVMDVSLLYALALGVMITLVYILLLFLTKGLDSEDIELFKESLRKYGLIR